MSLGTLVVNEVPIPITELALRDGKLIVTAHMDATGRKIDLPHGCEARVHAADGSLVLVVVFRYPDGIHLSGETGPTGLMVELPIAYVGKAAVDWPVRA